MKIFDQFLITAEMVLKKHIGASDAVGQTYKGDTASPNSFTVCGSQKGFVKYLSELKVIRHKEQESIIWVMCFLQLMWMYPEFHKI
ncbi:MAG TPA: hypothetical protein VFF14_09720 [Candidatus Deferrimicrobium sp.]|nr:hypothetical protein [Candidatus Deferrimicrobium sp.]